MVIVAELDPAVAVMALHLSPGPLAEWAAPVGIDDQPSCFRIGHLHPLDAIWRIQDDINVLSAIYAIRRRYVK